MDEIEIIISAVSLISLVSCIVTLFLTYGWKIRVEKKYREIEKVYSEIDGSMDYLSDQLVEQNDDLYNLQRDFADIGIETLKVRSEDHDRAIESIRKDLLDLQVLSGTLPSRAGTMLQEVENTLEELRAVKSNYLETRAIVDDTKEKMEKLAEAYASLHFTGKEIEEMRSSLEALKLDV